MGIGADNIFVFYDHWCHTEHIKIMKKRYPLRMAYTFRKAGSAMAVTSVTTAASFLATCISPVMPIISFGLFAAITVVVNFAMIISTVPLIIMVHEVHVKPYFKCCSCNKKKDPEEVEPSKNRRGAKSSFDLRPLKMIPVEENERINFDNYFAWSSDKIAVFFEKYLSKVVFFLRWPIILGGFTWLFACCIMGTSIPRKSRINDLLAESMRV